MGAVEAVVVEAVVVLEETTVDLCGAVLPLCFVLRVVLLPRASGVWSTFVCCFCNFC